MPNEHTFSLPREEFEQLLERGTLRVEADLYVGDEAVKHTSAPLVYRVERDGQTVRLTFAGLD